MSKKIAYLLTSHGMDGMGHRSVLHAFWTEEERNECLATSPNKNWWSKEEEIVDEEKEAKQHRAKLGAMGRLVLGVE